MNIFFIRNDKMNMNEVCRSCRGRRCAFLKWFRVFVHFLSGFVFLDFRVYDFRFYSEEEARMKIYSVSTRHYFAFGALVSEELSYKLKGICAFEPSGFCLDFMLTRVSYAWFCFGIAELPGVRWVLPDSYLNVKEKDYGGKLCCSVVCLFVYI